MREGVTPRKRHRTVYMRGYRQRSRSVEREGGGLLPYQREFLAAVTRRDNRPGDSSMLSWSWERQDFFGWCPVGKGG